MEETTGQVRGREFQVLPGGFHESASHLHLSAVPGSFCPSPLVGPSTLAEPPPSLSCRLTHTHTRMELELRRMCQSSEKVTVIHHPVIPQNLALIRGFFSLFFPIRN